MKKLTGKEMADAVTNYTDPSTTSETTGKEIADAMTDYVNTFSMNERSKEFIDGFCRQHRTLQQSSFRMMLELMQHMASEEYHTDGRNQASKDVAKKLLKGFKNETIKEFVEQGSSEERAKRDCESEYFKPSAFLSFI